MKAACLIISMVLALLLFIFYDHISDTVYYFWDKMKDFVLLLTVTILLNGVWKNYFKIATAFFGCRLLSQIIITAFPHLQILPYLTYLLWGFILCIIFYDELIKLYYKVLILFARKFVNKN